MPAEVRPSTAAGTRRAARAQRGAAAQRSALNRRWCCNPIVGPTLGFTTALAHLKAELPL